MPKQESIPEGAEVQLERALLGAVLLNQDHIFELTTELKPDDFSIDSHRLIYRGMLALSARNQAIDSLTLGKELTRQQTFTKAGGDSYLSDLTTNAIRRKSLASHLRLVKDASMRRHALHQGERFISTLSDPSESTRDCLDMMHEWLLDVAAGDRQGQAEPIAQFEDAVYRKLVEQSESKELVLGIPTGLPSLDKETTGIRQSEYWIVAGWPGHGKSALMMQMARAAVEQGKQRVGVFSLEMRKDQLLLRMWAALAQIPAWKVRDPRQFSPGDWEKLDVARKTSAAWPIFIDDQTGLSPENLTARAHLMIRRHDCSILFLDYIQKVRATGRDRREKVGDISSALFHLAKTTTVPVVALSQLSRPKDSELGHEPTMFQLKESGDLEADADTIVLIHRKFDKDKQPDTIIVGKQRNGAADARVEVRFNGANLMFEEPGMGQLAFSNDKGE